MSLSASVSRSIRKILKIALVVEVVYVVLVNALLQLPLTQTVINQIRPEKFQVTWDNAWTLYPFRVQLRGGSANGDSRTQTWQADVKSAAGSINPLPLVLRRVRVSDVRASDVHFRMRPRLKPDKDYSQVEMYFPQIEGREPSNAITTPRKEKRSWLVSIEDIRVTGSNSYWIYQFQGTADGTIRADLDYKTRGGPLELDVTDFDLTLGRHLVNGDQEMFATGKVAGSMGFAPFMPREDKGLKLLEFLKLDIGMDFDVSRLKFIDLFLTGIDGFTVDGSGAVTGRVRYHEGELLEGTDLDVAASDLRVRFMDHVVGGEGTVDLSTGPEKGGQLDLGFRFSDLEVFQGDDPRAMMAGHNLLLQVGGDNRLLPDPEQVNESRSVRLDINEVTVHDMSVFNAYLPPGLPMAFTGGEASLESDLAFKALDAGGWLKLKSREARIDVLQQSITADLLADIQLTGGRPIERVLDVSGSEVVLKDVLVVGEKQEFEDKAWAAALELSRGDIVAEDPPRFDLEASLEASDSRPIVALFRNREGWQPEFLARAMTVEDIEGTARVITVGRRVEIPEAYVTSDNVEAGMKAVFTEKSNNGIIYLKYKKLDAVLKILDGDRNFDLVKARKKYDAYEMKP